MFRNLSLRARLMTIGLLVMVVPLVVITSVIVNKQRQMRVESAAQCRSLALADLDHIAQGILAMCETQQVVLEDMVTDGLALIRAEMERKGPATFDAEHVTWQAVNQYTEETTTVELPRMSVGTTWLGQNRSQRTPSPVVDEVCELVGGTATIFQRMNDRGDMLRVCTNVTKTDGERAIGTYIPAVNPDGKPNPVVSSVLDGKTFHGRAYVVDRWYITAYEPIRGADGDVVGVSYFGVPMESVTALRQSIMDTRVGETGYVYVLDSSGNYVISADGERDGESIWNAKDSDGNLFIQEIIAKALALPEGGIAEQDYPWKNKGEDRARLKIARIAYFEPWDWVIGVGSYEEEFMAAEHAIARLGKENITATLITGGVCLLIAAILWFLVATRTANGIDRVADRLGQASSQVGTSSREVSASSQQMADGAGEQAASLEQIAASLQEMAAGVQQTAANATDTDREAVTAAENAQRGVDAMQQMATVIGEIKNSSDETARILKTIDEIAFQTNLLALNAAVEAARAGEAGKGFAVVAEEVRNLAQRSADAARNTATLIEQSQQSADGGVTATEQVSSILEDITGSIDRVKHLVSDVASASREQADGIGEINNAVARLDQVTQNNAASAEESAAASKELEQQAGAVAAAVDALRELTNSGGGSLVTPVAGTTPRGRVMNGTTFSQQTAYPVPASSRAGTTSSRAGTTSPRAAAASPRASAAPARDRAPAADDRAAVLDDRAAAAVPAGIMDEVLPLDDDEFDDL